MTNKRRPGPDPERLKLPFSNWMDAVRRALQRERPPDGWPDEQEPEREGETDDDDS